MPRNNNQGELIDDMFGGFPQCSDCVHKRGDVTCKAFPKRIPDEILHGEHDHTEAFPGDGGTTYRKQKRRG